MSAIHTGSIAVRPRENGRLEYTGKSENRAIADWSPFEPEQDFQSAIPAQQTGNAFEKTAGCAACGCPCDSGPPCSCTCCCSYEPAVADAAQMVGGAR